VLVSRGAAVHEVLTDGENSLLFPPCNPEELAARIQELMSRPALRAKIAQEGMDLVHTRFTWGQFAGQVEDACKDVVAMKG
jgi:glycosyltransferase involved in cell wall biosynthesis